ncbi:MAG: UDP-GlcNAc--UDP-phosphate GlcNAc-1-phosphate transferase [Bacteroidia bacterium]
MIGLFENMALSLAIVVAVLFAVINLYFVVARRYSLVDVPNERSSHSKSTIVGAGILFYLTAIWYFLADPNDSIYFILGISLLAFISFMDDRMEINSLLRLGVHIAAILLLLLQLQILVYLDWWTILLIIVVLVGTLNAYNFMDGINGITGIYSLVCLLSVYFFSRFNHYDDLILYESCAVVVFLFYNFRKKAVCFSGDVGSVTMAFIVVMILLNQMVLSQRWETILFLAVYGVDSVLTIVHRISNRENIFKAHRSHIYQLLVHNKKWSHLKVSLVYGGIQLLINTIYFLLADANAFTVTAVSLGVFVVLGLLSIILRRQLNESPVHS